MTVDNIVLEDVDGERTAILRGPWHPDMEPLISGQSCRSLHLNTTKGWDGNSLDFLKRINFLRSIKIISSKEIDLEVIESLKTLEKLSIIAPYRGKLNLSSLPNLTHLSIHWSNKISGLGNCHALRELFIERPSKTAILEVSKVAAHLLRLDISTTKIPPIPEILRSASMRFLRFRNVTFLDGLRGIERLPNLVSLEIDESRAVGDLTPISTLRKLSRLGLNGCHSIPSLLPVEALPIEELYFVGTTHIEDGKVCFLKAMSSLRETSFMNRRNYDCTREEISAALKTR